ncbi:sodium ion-translocating decarboxylase, beta subunit [Pyramidobacter piscolens W5455]|uniref:Sodium ion-translocating decarboxylase, beta subunit n=1 Tax=Pyramidobacter piscolens W5455 TaxID=352165 RepID=A0ABP2HVE9_9BACT|nr:sodium ion-translocating decarboxylase subunit beta [Pyramidobacter piscolens]EFB91171.1 sodium ion-translocating decarboxylase, beta subunit [Pyramidobacter piscolens W5455]
MEALFQGFLSLTWQQAVMIGIGLTLIWLAAAKEYEPSLLLPMGFGTVLVNIPMTAALTQAVGGTVVPGAISVLFDAGIANEMFPLLIFIGIGAMMDFSPVMERPVYALFGLTAQVGIFLTMGLAYYVFGFSVREAASIGIIGAADGPTSIFVSSRFAPQLLGPISVAAYSYMSMVPVIQPPVVRALTTKEERRMNMTLRAGRTVSKRARILFPIVVTIVVGIFAPSSSTLIGFLMFGNLLRESGVVARLSNSAQNELANIVTIMLGLGISCTMTGDRFLRADTLMILGMGLVAFVFDTAGGVLSAKLLNLFMKEKINPMIGAAGISAFPMSSRTIQQMAAREKPGTFVLMQASAANVAGQIGSVVAGGLLLALLS